MKQILFALLCITGMFVSGWETNFEKAKKLAKEQDKLILLNFSGSDWCGPCIRMHREIFSSNQFSRIADSTLIMVNADFPRDKKHQLSKEQKTHNEALADQYNPAGKFPFTLLLDADGKVIRSWDGLPPQSAAEFSKELKQLYESRIQQKNNAP